MKAVYLSLLGIGFFLLSAIELRAQAFKLGSFTFAFAEQDGYVLGLQNVVFKGRTLKSDQHVFLPLLTQEWEENRVILPFFKLESQEVTGEKLSLRFGVYGAHDEALCRHFFMMAPDTVIARKSQPDLYQKHKSALAAAAQQLHTELLKADSYKAKWLEWNALPQPTEGLTFRNREKMELAIQKAQKALEKEKKAILSQPQTANPALAKAIENLNQTEAKFKIWQNAFSSIHRDVHSHAIPEQMEYSTHVDSLLALLRRHKAGLSRKGEFTWNISLVKDEAFPEAQGWKMDCGFSLQENLKVNVLRYLASWEIGGKAQGNRIINFRYRGLGNIEQVIENEPFSTSDIWPEPYRTNKQVVPKKFYQNLDAKSLEMRASANLFMPALGAGNAFFQLQTRDNLALLAFRNRQGNFRGVVEHFPPSKTIGHIQEERFANTHTHRSEPMVFLVFEQKDLGNKTHLYRNLWSKANRLLRQRVARELNFIETDVKPAVGMNWDIHQPGKSFTNCALNLNKIVPDLAREGVQSILCHNSGWINGQSLRLGLDGQDTTDYLGSGSCNMYDWVPLPKLVPAWQQLHKSLSDKKIDYFVWVTSMSKAGGSFTREVGLSPKNWALNRPDGFLNAMYGTDMLKHNVLSPDFKRVFRQRISTGKSRYGLDGIWLDSFHNLWMSELDWASGSGAPMQRVWWELIAQWSREGIQPIGECDAFPGLSCSIELDGAETQPWYFDKTSYWLRNGAHKKRSKSSLDSLAYKLLACGGWLTPDILPYASDGPYELANAQYPGFSHLAALHKAAIGNKHALTFLPDEAGVVWTSEDGKSSTLFVFKPDAPLFSGKRFLNLLSGKLEAPRWFQAYRMTGEMFN